MTIQVKIIKDSISPNNDRITTFQLMYPRFIHSEFMTHRMFSRNASSSRAIPVKKMIEMVRNDPAMPIHWGKNQPGMQADTELSDSYDPKLGTSERQYVKNLWQQAAREAAFLAERMMDLGTHKQIANRILEPFQHIHVVVTATEWQNFFDLRAHPDAQPEIQALAFAMQDELAASEPDIVLPGGWHLPYIDKEELDKIFDECMTTPIDHGYWDTVRKISAARCCRVSYLKHDGNPASIKEDLDLCDRLMASRPIHASPFEHQATPDVNTDGAWECGHSHGNFIGWIQYRKMIEYQFD